MKSKIVVVVYIFLIIFLGIYSYALIDPNLTLLSHPYWVMFRDPMVYLGYHMRQESALIYIVLLILLTIVHVALISNSKKIHPLALAVITGLILICSR